MGFSTQFHAPPWSIVVQDDGRTCYAYLLRSGAVRCSSGSVRSPR